MKVIAPIGMPGSGKTEANTYLQKKYGWPNVYFGQPTFDEMERLGLSATQENEKQARESLRNQFGEDHYAEVVVKKIEALGAEPFVLVESLYSLAEYQVLKRHFGENFVTIAIHASPKVRHTRLATRPKRPLTETEAVERDLSQLTRLTQGGPIALADFVVVNEGSIENLYTQLDTAIETLKR